MCCWRECHQVEEGRLVIMVLKLLMKRVSRNNSMLGAEDLNEKRSVDRLERPKTKICSSPFDEP